MFLFNILDQQSDIWYENELQNIGDIRHYVGVAVCLMTVSEVCP